MYATQCNRMKPRHETVHTGLPRAKTSLCQKFQKECVSVSSKCLCLTKRPARSSSTKILAGAICWGDFFSAAALNSHDDQADFERGKNFKFPSRLPPARRQLRRAGPPSHLPQPGCRRILTGREQAAAGGSAATSWQLGKDRDTQRALARPASVPYDCTRHSARDSDLCSLQVNHGPCRLAGPPPLPDPRRPGPGQLYTYIHTYRPHTYIHTYRYIHTDRHRAPVSAPGPHLRHPGATRCARGAMGWDPGPSPPVRTREKGEGRQKAQRPGEPGAESRRE